MRILLLAGTGEAKTLAMRIVAGGHTVMASLAGATRAPAPLPCDMRIGGFGGREGFIRYINAFQPDLVVDATHPFAARITARTAMICQQLDIPYILLSRPPWQPDPARAIHEVASVDAARPMIVRATRLFLATGRQTLEDFSGFMDCTLICRQIDPPDGPFPFPNGKFLIGRPPFSVEDEKALFQRERIDWLIVKNAGGAASYSKIEAAAQLGIPVIMLARPTLPDAPVASTVDEVMEWVDRHARH